MIKKWKVIKTYYPAYKYAGTEKERKAQFRGRFGGLYDIKIVKAK